MWDSDARLGAEISIDLAYRPIEALPPRAADVIAAWQSAPAYPKVKSPGGGETPP